MTNILQTFVKKSGIKSFVMLLAALSLSGCAQTYSTPQGGNINQPDFQRNNPIKVTQGKQEIDLVPPKGAYGLTPGQVAASASFIIDYMDKGEGRLEIWAPRGNKNTAAINRAQKTIKNILYDAAIPNSAIDYRSYNAHGNSKAPLGMKFKRYYASVEKCGGIRTNLGANYNNVNYKSFGCAYQTNIAAMVSNPKDLLGPGAMSGASAERRQIIWAKYVAGQPTGATRSADERVLIKDVAK